MRLRIPALASALLCLFIFPSSTVVAQSLVTTMTLGRDELGLVKTSQGISTKLSFPERIKEIICGDLYDPADGRGNFVIQRSDNDLFLKPVASSGISNLFVKTGESGEYTYSFELLVVPVTQSFRIVNITNGHTNKKAVSKTVARPPVIARVDSMPGVVADEPTLGVPALDVPGIEPGAALEAPPTPASNTTLNAGPARGPNPKGASRKTGDSRVALQSEAIKREKPPYPDAAKQAGVSGEVVVEVVVDERGRVTAAKAISGHALLRTAAVIAARAWRFRPFRPTKVDGVPVEAVGTITFVFKSTNTERDSLSESNLSDVRKPPKH